MKMVSFSVDDGKSWQFGREIPQVNGLVTVERTYDALEIQPDGSHLLSRVLSIQGLDEQVAAGVQLIGWRPEGANGALEKAIKVDGYYLYAPEWRLRGNLRGPVFPITRFKEFEL